jgi:acyl dehydratase
MNNADNRLYLEDIEVGRVMMSPGRTVTEADIVMFANMTGDWSAAHTDDEFCKTSMYGKRVAHGALGFAIHSGLLTRTVEFQRVVGLAGLGFREWKYTGPIFVGDTVTLKITVVNTRITSKKDRGILTLKRELVNQDGKTVQEGFSDILVATRPKE